MIRSFLIVVPTLDSYSLLPKLLDSLQRQSWPHWRLLFIDGPSGAEHRQWLEQCCADNPRCQWLQQDPAEQGIFGAMNQGFACAGFNDWLMFWGSDDWAASDTVFSEVVSNLEMKIFQNNPPDMIVCRGRYVDAVGGTHSRYTAFQHSGMLGSAAYRRALFFGSTPPHQATLLGPGARQRLARYSSGFRLSADLDYFLRLGQSSFLRVYCLDLEFVHISTGGVSGKQTQRRLKEVRRAYRLAFGRHWWFPFFMRYLRRLASLMESIR